MQRQTGEMSARLREAATMYRIRISDHSWLMVALLFLFMLVNFADKAVIGIAAVPMMQELQLSPREFGLIGSSFFLLFSLSAIVTGFIVNRVQTELSPNFGDGLKDQAAAWARGAAELPMTSIPSVNLIPWISFGNWLWPSMWRQFLCAPSTSLKTMASAVLFDRQPFDRMVRCRTVAKVLSMGFVVRKCFQYVAGKS